MSSEIAEIISAMEFAAQRGLRHFVHDDGKTRLALWRDGVAAAPPAVRTIRKPASATPATDPTEAVEDGIVTAPLPGLCHLAPDPVSPPFVTEGARVAAGQTICIIEAMKVMSAVPAPRAGTVTKVHVTDGAAVAAGDRLFEIGV